MQHTAHHDSAVHHTEHFAHPKRNVVDHLGIEHDMHVADFGAGSGHYALEIAKHLEGSGHVYAIDVQRDLLKRIHNEATRRHLNNISIIWGDLEQYGASKIAPRHADVVLISNLLFQVTLKPAVIAEAKRILKPKGRLIIIDWSESFGHMGPHPEEVVSRDRAHMLAREGGFDLVQTFPAGAHHYGLVFRLGGLHAQD